MQGNLPAFITQAYHTSIHTSLSSRFVSEKILCEPAWPIQTWAFETWNLWTSHWSCGLNSSDHSQPCSRSLLVEQLSSNHNHFPIAQRIHNCDSPLKLVLMMNRLIYSAVQVNQYIFLPEKIHNHNRYEWNEALCHWMSHSWAIWRERGRPNDVNLQATK